VRCLPPLIPLLIFLVVILIIWWITVRFSPDPLITKIVQVILFIVVIIKLLSMLGIA
jgi:hypothetical protein